MLCVMADDDDDVCVGGEGGGGLACRPNLLEDLNIHKQRKKLGMYART